MENQHIEFLSESRNDNLVIQSFFFCCYFPCYLYHIYGNTYTQHV